MSESKAAAIRMPPAQQTVVIEDSLGRKLTFTPLSMSETLDLLEIAGAAASNGPWQNNSTHIASVRLIDGVPPPPITSKLMLKKVADMVGYEGIIAINAHIVAETEKAIAAAQASQSADVTVQSEQEPAEKN